MSCINRGRSWFFSFTSWNDSSRLLHSTQFVIESKFHDTYAISFNQFGLFLETIFGENTFGFSIGIELCVEWFYALACIIYKITKFWLKTHEQTRVHFYTCRVFVKSFRANIMQLNFCCTAVVGIINLLHFSLSGQIESYFTNLIHIPATRSISETDWDIFPILKHLLNERIERMWRYCSFWDHGYCLWIQSKQVKWTLPTFCWHLMRSQKSIGCLQMKLILEFPTFWRLNSIRA